MKYKNPESGYNTPVRRNEAYSFASLTTKSIRGKRYRCIANPVSQESSEFVKAWQEDRKYILVLPVLILKYNYWRIIKI